MMGSQNNLKGKTEEIMAVPFDEALEKIGTGWFQYKVILVGAIIIISSYMPGGSIAFILPAAQCDLGMNSAEKGRLATAPFIAVIFSCHLWGFLSDTLGRRYVLLRCLFCDALIFIITMLIPNYYNVILILRMLSGISACGGVVSIFAYIGEFQTDKFRSKALIITTFLSFTSLFLVPAVAWLIISAQWQFELYPGLIFKPWRQFYVLCSIPSLFGAICLSFLPESPKFLLAKGETTKAIKVLQKMHRENNGNDDFSIKYLKGDEKEKIGKMEGNKSKIASFLQLVWNQTIPLLRKPYRNNFLLVSLALFCIYYINSNLYVWLPQAINKMETFKTETGLTDSTYCQLMQYKTHQNNSENSSTNTSDLINETLNQTCNENIEDAVFINYIVLGSIQTIVWLIVLIITKFLSKKYLLVCMSICALVVTLSMKISSTLLLIRIKASLAILFTGILFPIINVLIVDLFPTNIRAMASCLTLISCRLGTMLTNTMAGMLVDTHCSILLWSLITAAAVTFLSISLLPSTESQAKRAKVTNELI